MNKILNRRKKIEDLISEILNYDIVISNDPILSNKLNSILLEKQRITRVYTPKQLLREYYPNLYDKKYEILNVIKRNKKVSFKQLDKLYYDYIKYKIDGEGSIDDKWLDVFDRIKTIYSINKDDVDLLLDKIEVNNKHIAILDYLMFNKLDELFVRDKYKKISLFCDDKINLKNIILFNNEYELVDYLVDTLTDNKKKNSLNEKNVAIFISNSSKYKSLIKYKFKQNEIEIRENQYDPRRNQISLLLEMIKTVLFVDSMKIKENLQMMQYLKIKYSNKEINSYLREINKKSIKDYYKMLISLKTKKVVDVLDILKINSNELKNILYEANLLNIEINYLNYNEIKYYFKKIFEYEVQKTQGISLLSSDSRNQTINREFVFFLGMDSNLDQDYEKFKRLIQSVDNVYFLFAREEDGIKTFPSNNFSKLLDTNIKGYEDFKEIIEISYRFNNKVDILPDKTLKNTIKLSDKENIRLSASKLTSYKQCPKRYFYSNIIINPDTYEMLRGTYVHNFCECYLNDNKLVLENKDKLIDYIVSKLKVYENKNEELIRSEINYYFNLLIKYLDQIELKNIINVIDYKTDKTKRNELAVFLDMNLNLNNSEFMFKVDNIVGFLDLIVDNNTIIDYKTKNLPQNLANLVHPLYMQDDCDFQPLVYLYYLRKISTNIKNSKFIYLFLKNDISKKMYNNDTLVDKVTIEYIDQYFMDYLKNSKDVQNLFYSEFGDIMDFDEFYSILLKILSKINNKVFLIKKNILDTYLKQEFKMRQNKIVTFIRNLRIGNKNKFYYYKEDIDFFREEKENIEKSIINDMQCGFKANPINKRNCKMCPYKIYCTGIYDD